MKKHGILLSVAITSMSGQVTGCGIRDTEDVKKIVENYTSDGKSEDSKASDVKAATADKPKVDKASNGATEKTSDKAPDKQAQGVPGSIAAKSLSSMELVARQSVNSCLKAWNGKAPFDDKSPFRTLLTGVMVFGIGTAIDDTQKTAAPELVLIPAGVNVLGTAKYRLLNPNGWYCLASTVNVLGNLSIEVAANAEIADSTVDVMVAGKQNVTNTGFVTVNVGGGIALKVVN
jgi:hypothetical protein